MAMAGQCGDVRTVNLEGSVLFKRDASAHMAIPHEAGNPRDDVLRVNDPPCVGHGRVVGFCEYVVAHTRRAIVVHRNLRRWPSWTAKGQNTL